MDSPEWFVFTLLRLLIPLAILRWPLMGIAASISADWILSSLLPLPHGGFYHYQVWDKVLDTYYLGIAAYTACFWKDRVARAVGLFAFAYRAVGVMLFVITENWQLMLLFPNFFENFFIFYLLFRKFSKSEKLFSSNLMFAVIIAAILTPKLAQEYFMHVAFIRLQDIFTVPTPAWVPVDLTSVLQWVLYLILPAAVLFWRVKLVRNRASG